MLFSASHSGYERLPQPVRHRRFVLQFERNLYLIRDVLLGEGTHLLETSWHFAPELEISQSGKAFIAAPAQQRSAEAQQVHLMLLPVDDSRWKLALRSEYVSPAYGEKVSAPVLRCSAGHPVPAGTAMLLIAGVNAQADADQLRSLIRAELESGKLENPDAVYRYEQGNTSHAFIFAPGMRTWSYGAWASDARFLHLRVKDGRIDALRLCGGTSIQFQGESLMSHSSVLQWLEWSNDRGQEQVACSDPAGPSFDASILGQAGI